MLIPISVLLETPKSHLGRHRPSHPGWWGPHQTRQVHREGLDHVCCFSMDMLPKLSRLVAWSWFLRSLGCIHSRWDPAHQKCIITYIAFSKHILKFTYLVLNPASWKGEKESAPNIHYETPLILTGDNCRDLEHRFTGGCSCVLYVSETSEPATTLE